MDNLGSCGNGIFRLFWFFLTIFYIFQDVTELSLDFIFDINELVYILGINFILSYFVTALTTSAHHVGNIVYDSLWYEMPKQEQFMVQMVMRHAQRPFELRGMGVFVCSLQTFLTVNEKDIDELITSSDSLEKH